MLNDKPYYLIIAYSDITTYNHLEDYNQNNKTKHD